MPKMIQAQFQADSEAIGRRLDQVLAEQFPEHSRARLQQWTRNGEITVDDRQVKPGLKLKGGEIVQLSVTIVPDAETPKAEPIPIDVVHADEQILVINKPAGLVVHPAAGNPDGTLQNALLHHDPNLDVVPRAGIVHRLDRLTSGIMVVARTLEAHTALVRQLQDRSMSRRYLTIVNRPLIAGGKVDQAIGRHPKDRKKMAVVADGKPAVTHYRVAGRFRDFALLEVHLETGRTHQIRVHMAHIKHSVLGDPVYGMRLGLPAGASEHLVETLRGFRRQALHAQALSFLHPADGELVSYQATMPDDMVNLLKALESDESQRI